MGYERAVAHEDDGRDTPCLDGLIATLIHFPALVVDPLTLRQIHSAAVARLQQGSNQHLRAEHILVFYEPGPRILRELNQQGAHHRQSALRAILCLGIDIRHQTVFHLRTVAEGICERLRDEPGLRGRCAVGTGMTAEESEGQPATVDILWRGGHETAHVVTPEREPRKSETQSATQVAQHTYIISSRVATPVQGVAL